MSLRLTKHLTRLYKPIINENQDDKSMSSHNWFMVAGNGGLLTSSLTGVQQPCTAAYNAQVCMAHDLPYTALLQQK